MRKEKKIKSEKLAFFIVGILVFALFITGCNKGLSTERSDSVDGNGLPIVTVNSLVPTVAVAGTLEVAVVDGTDGFEVSVRAGEDMPIVDELFFQIIYDPKELHAEAITIDNSSGDGSSLDLAFEAVPGTIEVGIVATSLATGPAVRPGDALLSFRLVEGPGAKESSAVNDAHLSRARNLEFNEVEGNWILTWDYTNPGDNNQDGEVGVADISPIAMHYGKQVENDWDDPLRNVDGDHNGEINLADITVIAMNYASQLWAYQIEMSEDGIRDFIMVGQYLLGDFNGTPAEAVRFSYEFGAQYVPGAWYRVVALNRNLEFGPPSEAISESGRRVDPIVVDDGGTVTITVTASDLDVPITHMNAARVIFPSSFSYVSRSTNPGSIGGDVETADGIWGSFATAILFPPDALLSPKDLGDGFSAMDFNVTVFSTILDGAPVGYGDLFNFKLEGDGTADLTLEFVVTSDDGILRTYYTDIDGGQHEFGNKLGFTIKETRSPATPSV